MTRLFSGRSDMPFALLLLAPSLLLLGGLVAWPMISNIEISFLRLPLNPRIDATFVGLSNYYSRAEVNEMQILKQADVVMLTYMLPERFSTDICLRNLNFYEPRTIHDSSLSKSIHGIVSARCGDAEQGYRFWREGTLIDLGDDPHSCDDGIHAAATGAIWLGAIQGFAGLSVREGELHLNPALPDVWRQLTFPLRWQGSELRISLSRQEARISSTRPVTLWLNGTALTVNGEQTRSLADFILPTNGTATTQKEGE